MFKSNFMGLNGLINVEKYLQVFNSGRGTFFVYTEWNLVELHLWDN